MEDLKEKKSSQTTASGIYICYRNKNIYFYLLVLDTRYGSHVCTNVEGLSRSRDLQNGEVNLLVGNGAKVATLAIGTYELILPSGLLLVLNDCFYVLALSRIIISTSCLDNEGFSFIIENNKCSIHNKDMFYANTDLHDGLYVLNVKHESGSVYNINTKKLKFNDFNMTYPWHYRLGHINEKSISR